MKFSWTSVTIPAAALVFLVACGGGASVAERPGPTPSAATLPAVAVDTPLPVVTDNTPSLAAAADTSLPVVEPAPVVKPAPNVEIGSAVGERVPDFEFTLLDGSSVSRVALAADERPAFLFFMATW